MFTILVIISLYNCLGEPDDYDRSLFKGKRQRQKRRGVKTHRKKGGSKKNKGNDN